MKDIKALNEQFADITLGDIVLVEYKNKYSDDNTFSVGFVRALDDKGIYLGRTDPDHLQPAFPYKRHFNFSRIVSYEILKKKNE